MKTGNTLALTLGMAAGAVVTLLVTGRNTRKNKPYGISFQGERGLRLSSSNKYDDSEVYYI